MCLSIQDCEKKRRKGQRVMFKAQVAREFHAKKIARLSGFRISEDIFYAADSYDVKKFSEMKILGGQSFSSITSFRSTFLSPFC